MYRRNIAERVIISFNDHFIAGICAMDPELPMQNWDHLLEHTDIMLNILRPSRLNKRLSAYVKLNGEFDFNLNPIAPLGTRTLVHDKPHSRGTWPPHGHKSWYVRLAMLHYRCLTFYILDITQSPQHFGTHKTSKNKHFKG